MAPLLSWPTDRFRYSDTTPPQSGRCVGLTQAAAMEWSQYGITVNAYCPGIVGTDMWDLIDEKLAEHEGLQKGQAIEKYSDLIHLGRVSVPEDVAAYVSYLASEDSNYMTGQSVMIDGGIQFS